MRIRTAIALLALAPLLLHPPPVLAAKAKASKSVGPLGRRAAPPLHLAPTVAPSVELPPWMDWVMRVARGDAFSYLRPSWNGAHPLGQWHLGLDAGLRGIGGLGYGAGFELSGSFRHRIWHLDGQLAALLTPGGVGSSLELYFAAAPLGIRVRSWQEPGASSPGQSATLTLRQSF